MSARTVFMVAAIALAGSACSHSVHVTHTSDFHFEGPPERYKVIEATAEQFTFLGMVGQTEYVDQAFADLQAKCPGGHVTGIQTRYSTSHGFFSWTNKVVMRGYCGR
ncbi:MAG: hypothetical protein CMH57_15895 [Myxococcales bacterium]|nr:hypothetical protein [Myxococcales bacterium]